MKKSKLLHVILLTILMCSTTGLAVNLVISNINQPETDYIVHYNNLVVGQKIYTDRDYTFVGVASLGDSTYIQTKNDDKYSTGSSFLTFDINMDCIVYVAHDDTSSPSWLTSSFTHTDESLSAHTTFDLWSKNFAAGTVILGGNEGDGTSSMYLVVVVPIVTTAPDPASNPVPADDSINISSRECILSWIKGTGAISHDVYFGDSNPPAFIGNQTEGTYEPGILANGTPYYWRIDEVNSYGTTTGTVWSFTTSVKTAWSFDDNESSSTVLNVVDSHHGTFSDATGDTNTNAHHSADCKEGEGSLSFDGIDDYVEISGYKGITGGNSRTCTAWIKTATPNTEILSWGSLDAGGKWLLLLNGNGNFQVSVNGGSIVGSTLLTDNQWHHIAVVLSNDGSTDISEAKLYVDGHVEPISASSSCSVSTGSIQNVQIGLCQVQAAYRYFQGLIDDVRIFDYALSSEEIYHLLYPANAWNPSPANGSRFTNVTSGLYWSAGEEAISHDVYFGTSESTVTNAQRLIGDINGDGPVNIKDLSILASQWLTSPGAVSPSADIELNGQVDINDFAAIAAMWGQTPDTVFQGNQIETSFDAGALEYGTTYYWRIDEVNGTDPQSPHKGQVWQFTNTEPTIEIMPLGDSITQGATPGGYRYYLWDKLRNDGYTNINFVGGLTSSDSLDYDKDHEGHWGQNAEYISANINAYLNNNPPDIILLHIGTNGVEDIPVDIVEGILNKIDAFESSTGRNIVVILAKIINRRTDVADPTQVANTTIYNNGLGEMAQARINNGDDIILVDMENGAGFEYTTVDMLDEKHPNTAGNQKMANLWYSALKTILPAK